VKNAILAQNSGMNKLAFPVNSFYDHFVMPEGVKKCHPHSGPQGWVDWSYGFI
jgi:hypothetical protein